MFVLRENNSGTYMVDCKLPDNSPTDDINNARIFPSKRSASACKGQHNYDQFDWEILEVKVTVELL